ncbi:MAG TPA: hypothetical protein VI277_00565 [Candidatus Limnocylindria bacterium]
MAERKAFLLRVDPHLYDALEKWASDELRSVNGQIEYLLTDAVRRSGRRGPGRESRRGGRDRAD